MAPLLLVITLLFSGKATTADRTLAAEGDYVDQKKNDKPLAHWKLWHHRSGEYEVVEALHGSTNVVQVFRFDPLFLPIGFSLTIEPLLPKVRQTVPFTIYPTIISCRYNVEDLKVGTKKTCNLRVCIP